MIHWTGNQARTTGTDAADAIIRQARQIEARDPRPAPFTPAQISRVAESKPAPKPVEQQQQEEQEQEPEAAQVPEPSVTPA
jgi:hypothetical protein